ncbi:UNVERIFIED_CONTAM: Beta-fructofuranosidase 1 [Sesamum radiatum]|uniref:beta-fructofuranosidase n=1 Tax=Sesamum radiatum TaxID=300843 RepID=A0AAW2MER2_SESRA
MPFPNPFPGLPSRNDDAPVSSYAPLLGSAPVEPTAAAQLMRRRRIFVVVLLLMMGLVGVCSLVILITSKDGGEDWSPSGEDDDKCPSPKEVSEYLKAPRPEEGKPTLRGVREGVSEKSLGKGRLGATPYPWTRKMLAWQRTAYHFQPEKNWMNGEILFYFLLDLDQQWSGKF